MKCLICGEECMEKDKTVYFANLGTCYVIIENVPCYKCKKCGEIVYSLSVMENIEEILEKVKNLASKIFICDYSNAA